MAMSFASTSFASWFVTLCSLACICQSYSVIPELSARKFAAPVVCHMGMFDGLMKAFGNEEFAAPPEGIKATARHILVESENDIKLIKEKIGQGIPFNSLAQEFSTCPSSAQGGSLGSFRPGVMVPEFDKVIFSPDTVLGEIVGPVSTKFGYHLIVVDKRSGV